MHVGDADRLAGAFPGGYDVCIVISGKDVEGLDPVPDVGIDEPVDGEHLVSHWLVELRGIEQASAEATPVHTPTVVELTVANSTGVIAVILGGRLGPRRAGREPVMAGAARDDRPDIDDHAVLYDMERVIAVDRAQ